MKKNRAKKYGSLRRVLVAMRLSLLAFAVLVCLAVFGVLMIRRSLLKNAQETGNALARGYAEEARSNLTVYQTLLSYGTAFLQDRLNQGYSMESLCDSAQMYFDRVTGVLGEGVVSPFLLVGDEIMTVSGVSPTDIDPAYDPTQREWYRTAVEADGKVAFTGLYTDVITGEPAISVVQSFNGGDVILGFDIFTENFHFQADSLSLARADSFFLCDKRSPPESWTPTRPPFWTWRDSGGACTTTGWKTDGIPSSRCLTAIFWVICGLSAAYWG